MIRRFACVILGAVVVVVVGGCEKPPVSTTPDAPIKSQDGVDKKGRKTRSMDATLEDPGAKKK